MLRSVPRLTLCATLVALSLLPLFSACGAEPRGGLVVLNPDDPERPRFHDMGTMPHGSRGEWVVRMQNLDPVPVTIRSINVACACVRAKSVRWIDADGKVLAEGDPQSREMALEVPAGGLLELVIGVYTASIRPNSERLAILTLVSTSKVTPFLAFELHINPQKLFSLKPSEARLAEIPRGYGGSQKINIMTGLRGSEARLLEVIETSAGVEAELDYLFVNNEHTWGLLVRVLPNQPPGAFRGKVVLSASDAQGQGTEQRLEVPVWAQVVEDVTITPHILNFGNLLPGVEGQLRAKVRALVPGARVKVIAIEVSGEVAEHLSVTFSPVGYVDADGRCEAWDVIVFSDTEMPQGRFRGALTVKLDDEQYPTLEKAFQGLVP